MTDSKVSISNPMGGTGMLGSALGRLTAKSAGAVSGEGFADYVIFTDVQSLTMIPIFPDTVMGKMKKFCCTLIGKYEMNRLIHIREKILPLMDAPVKILDINSKEGDSFLVLNGADKGTPTERHTARILGGLFQRGILYKLLPKEKMYVPVTDWAEEMERSEILEILTALQIAGAIVVEFEHKPSDVQIDKPEVPVQVDDDATLKERFFAYAFILFRFFRKNAAKAVAVSKGALTKSPVSPLTGRVVFHVNARPPQNVGQLQQEMGAELYHLPSQPAALRHIGFRLGRGIMTGHYFVHKHMTKDVTWLPAMKKLQQANTPPIQGVKFTEDHLIDTGYRSGNPRPRYETRFVVLYPDIKDTKEQRVGGQDLAQLVAEPTSEKLHQVGSFHALSSVDNFEDVMPRAVSKQTEKSEAPAKETSAGSSGGNKDTNTNCRISFDFNNGAVKAEKESSGGLMDTIKSLNPLRAVKAGTGLFTDAE